MRASSSPESFSTRSPCFQRATLTRIYTTARAIVTAMFEDDGRIQDLHCSLNDVTNYKGRVSVLNLFQSTDTNSAQCQVKQESFDRLAQAFVRKLNRCQAHKPNGFQIESVYRIVFLGTNCFIISMSNWQTSKIPESLEFETCRQEMQSSSLIAPLACVSHRSASNP